MSLDSTHVGIPQILLKSCRACQYKGMRWNSFCVCMCVCGVCVCVCVCNHFGSCLCHLEIWTGILTSLHLMRTLKTNSQSFILPESGKIF